MKILATIIVALVLTTLLVGFTINDTKKKYELDQKSTTISQCIQTAKMCDLCVTECTGKSGYETCVSLCKACAAECRKCATACEMEKDKAMVAMADCAAACDACALECEKHADMMKSCKRCAKSCRKCAKKCRSSI